MKLWLPMLFCLCTGVAQAASPAAGEAPVGAAGAPATPVTPANPVDPKAPPGLETPASTTPGDSADDAEPAAVDAAKAETPAPATPDASTPLTDTYWKLVELEDTKVHFRPGFRESHLRLLKGTDRFLGQGICNRVGGSFKLDGDKLALEVLDSHSSPCWPDGAPESALTDALNSTVGYVIEGRDLFLVDAEGVRRAHYVAMARPGERGEAVVR